MNASDIAGQLDTLRGFVQEDGANLELLGVDESERRVDLRLVLDGVECLECVLARPLLEDIVLDVLRRSVPDVARVSIDDPREQGATAPGPTH